MSSTNSIGMWSNFKFFLKYQLLALIYILLHKKKKKIAFMKENKEEIQIYVANYTGFLYLALFGFTSRLAKCEGNRTLL